MSVSGEGGRLGKRATTGEKQEMRYIQLVGVNKQVCKYYFVKTLTERDEKRLIPLSLPRQLRATLSALQHAAGGRRANECTHKMSCIYNYLLAHQPVCPNISTSTIAASTSSATTSPEPRSPRSSTPTSKRALSMVSPASKEFSPACANADKKMNTKMTLCITGIGIPIEEHFL